MWSELGYVILFFGFPFMTSSPGQSAEIVAQNLVGFWAVICVFRALVRLPGIFGAKVMVKRPEIL